MRELKFAIIGAGSTYTPELIEGLIVRKDNLKLDSLYLMDIDDRKLEIIYQFTKRMLEKGGINSKVVMTKSLDEAVEGANYVICQVRAGKLDARILDEKIPLKYNLLGQETTGAGGFMNALRTIPVIMNVARKMEKLAPDAWMINFSNPSGIIAEAVLNNSNVKMIGLCNGPYGMIKRAKEMLPEGTKEFDYDFVGLNHLCWITGIYADGKNIISEKLNSNTEFAKLKNLTETKRDDVLLRATGGIPVGYLDYYYFRDKKIQECKEKEKTRGEECKIIEEELLELYQQPELNEKPKQLEKRGGANYSTVAVSLIDAIENDKNEYHVVDVKNNGALDFMDKDDVVEVKCLVNKNGATPVKINNFDNQYIIGLMRAVKAYEKLTVKAGLTGDYDAALAALMVHPLIGDYVKAKGVLDEMLQANKEFLPQFKL